MPRGKKELAEQIIPKLREVEVEVGRGKTVLEAVKKIGVTEQTYYRWKKQFGGLRLRPCGAAVQRVQEELWPHPHRAPPPVPTVDEAANVKGKAFR